MNGRIKYILQKSAAIILPVIVFAALLSACTQEPVDTSPKEPVEISTKYMVGFDYSSGADWGMSPSIICKVRYDKSVDATFEWYDQNSEAVSRTLNFKLTDAQFSRIEQTVDPQEIYYLRPECNEDVCDGSSSWLFVYGPDDEVLKECGGYCPENARFNEISTVLYYNVPEKLIEVYSQYEEVWSSESPYEEEYLDRQLHYLFEEMYSQYVTD